MSNEYTSDKKGLYLIIGDCFPFLLFVSILFDISVISGAGVDFPKNSIKIEFAYKKKAFALKQFRLNFFKSEFSLPIHTVKNKLKRPIQSYSQSHSLSTT